MVSETGLASFSTERGKKMTQFKTVQLILVGLALLSTAAHADDPLGLPLVAIDDVKNHYQGSFKVEHSDSVSSTGYASGRVAYHPGRNSVFVDSHVYQQAIGEFRIPSSLSTSTDKSKLPNASVLQGFTVVQNRTDTGNPQSLNKIGGMAVIDGELFVQRYVSYDAGGETTHNTMVVRNATNLSGSEVDGYFQMDGGARVVNYISPIPPAWQSVLGGDYLAGQGSGMSIASRNSEGPSLYAFSKNDFDNRSSGTVSARAWLNYPVERALSTTLWQDSTVPGYGIWDAYNNTGLNTLWTEYSAAHVGFIYPGSRTFVVLGVSGMHEHGGGYKITTSTGSTCGGPCPYDNEDVHTYYWLYDLKEVVNADKSYEPLPYDWGVFDDRWVGFWGKGATGTISGGAFDPESGTLVISHVAGSASHESGSPIISVYKLPKEPTQNSASSVPPDSPSSVRVTPLSN